MRISIISSCGWKLLLSAFSLMSCSVLAPSLSLSDIHTQHNTHTHTHTHTHIHTPTDVRSNIQTLAESFTKDKRHPVGLRKRKRKREGEREEQPRFPPSFSFTSSPSVCTEETSLLSLHSPVSTVQLVLPLYTTTREGIEVDIHGSV